MIEENTVILGLDISAKNTDITSKFFQKYGIRQIFFVKSCIISIEGIK